MPFTQQETFNIGFEGPVQSPVVQSAPVTASPGSAIVEGLRGALGVLDTRRRVSQAQGREQAAANKERQKAENHRQATKLWTKAGQLRASGNTRAAETALQEASTFTASKDIPLDESLKTAYESFSGGHSFEDASFSPQQVEQRDYFDDNPDAATLAFSIKSKNPNMSDEEAEELAYSQHQQYKLNEYNLQRMEVDNRQSVLRLEPQRLDTANGLRSMLSGAISEGIKENTLTSDQIALWKIELEDQIADLNLRQQPGETEDDYRGVGAAVEALESTLAAAEALINDPEGRAKSNAYSLLGDVNPLVANILLNKPEILGEAYIDKFTSGLDVIANAGGPVEFRNFTTDSATAALTETPIEDVSPEVASTAETIAMLDAQGYGEVASGLSTFVNGTTPQEVGASEEASSTFGQYLSMLTVGITHREGSDILSATLVREVAAGNILPNIEAVAQRNPGEAKGLLNSFSRALYTERLRQEGALENILSNNRHLIKKDGVYDVDWDNMHKVVIGTTEKDVDRLQAWVNNSGGLVEVLKKGSVPLDPALKVVWNQVRGTGGARELANILPSLDLLNAKLRQAGELSESSDWAKEKPREQVGFQVPAELEEDFGFLSEVQRVANSVGVSEDDLMRVIHFETAGSFDPAIKNPGSTATGLIQFLESTAQELGTSTSDLAKMSRAEQMQFVEKYLLMRGKDKINNLGDLYMAIHWPAGMGKDDDYVMYSRDKNPQYYNVNTVLDINDDGVVTRGEAVQAVLGRSGGGASKLSKGVQGSRAISDDVVEAERKIVQELQRTPAAPVIAPVEDTTVVVEATGAEEVKTEELGTELRGDRRNRR